MPANVTGADKVVRNFNEVTKRVLSTALENLGLTAKELLEEAKSRVPVDTGELRDSGEVRVRGGRAQVVFTAEHAAVVHEDLQASHRAGEAKFLERPLLEEAKDFAKDLSRGITL